MIAFAYEGVRSSQGPVFPEVEVKTVFLDEEVEYFTNLTMDHSFLLCLISESFFGNIVESRIFLDHAVTSNWHIMAIKTIGIITIIFFLLNLRYREHRWEAAMQVILMLLLLQYCSQQHYQAPNPNPKAKTCDVPYETLKVCGIKNNTVSFYCSPSDDLEPTPALP